MISLFDDFRVKLNVELIEFVVYHWRDCRNAAMSDGREFLEKIEDDLKTLTEQLRNGKLAQEDFAWQLYGKKGSAELVELKKEGLPQAALDRFANGLVDTVVTTALNFFYIA